MGHQAQILLIVAGLCISGTVAAKKAEVIVYGGQINYTGQVINSPCVVSVDSENQQVLMGQVRKDQFSGLGSWADTQEFSIELQDCDSSLSQTVGVLFRGVTDSNDPLVFQTGGGGSAAKGIGLGIFDNKGKLVVPNGEPATYQILNDGTNVLPFIAKYRATKLLIQPGDANVTINFSMVYP